jgi:hypothetical protein
MLRKERHKIDKRFLAEINAVGIDDETQCTKGGQQKP